MGTNDDRAKLRVVTGKCRLSYVHLFEPWTNDPTEDDPKYSVTLLIPKSDKVTMKKLRAAEAAAKELGKTTKWNGKVPGNLKPSIIHDGDVEADLDRNPEYEGHFYMSVSSSIKYKPGVVDRNLNEILDSTEVYSGCYGRASIAAFPYTGRSNGVSFGLNNVQKLSDGEPLGGMTRAETDFDDDYEDDEEGEDLI